MASGYHGRYDERLNTAAILFDLDGTIWDGNETAAGALPFLQVVHSQGIPHLFISNNSWQTPQAVAGRLTRLGIPAEVNQVLTAGALAGAVIEKELGPSRLLVLGSADLERMLLDSGHSITDEKPNAVVVGLAEWSYADLTRASRAVATGLPLIAVNMDATMPGDGGLLLPKPGTMIAAIRTAVPDAPPPIVVGKPAPALFQEALRLLGLSADQVTMIGDGLATDIAGGRAAGMQTVWLHRGRPHDRHQADIVVRDLAEGLQYLSV